MRTTFLVDRTYTDIVVSDPSLSVYREDVPLGRMCLSCVPYIRP
jgi:hypothetical protein